jgi:RHS repeat-associated protein
MAEQFTTGGSYLNKWKFNGKELDTETGLYYYGARYYDPRTSVWLGVDPLAMDYPGFSPYNYTINNPIRMIDPDGKGPGDVVAGFMAAIADYTVNNNYLSIRSIGFCLTSDVNDYSLGLRIADAFVLSLGQTLMAKGTVDMASAGYIAGAGVATLVIPGVGEITFTGAEAAALAVAIEALVETGAGKYLYEKANENIKKDNFAAKKGPKDLVGDAKAAQAKKETSAQRTAKREAQSTIGNSRLGNSNKTIKGEHDGTGYSQKHQKGNARRAQDQRIKGPDDTK